MHNQNVFKVHVIVKIKSLHYCSTIIFSCSNMPHYCMMMVVCSILNNNYTPKGLSKKQAEPTLPIGDIEDGITEGK